MFLKKFKINKIGINNILIYIFTNIILKGIIIIKNIFIYIFFFFKDKK